jgi:hypothetical protein
MNRPKKKFRGAAIFLSVFALALTTALAVSVHLKGGKRAEPAFYDDLLVLRASGSLAGLGNEDTVITITALADPTGLCTNPGGESKVPGQNPAPVEVTGSISIPATEVKNGNTPFEVETEPPVTPIPGAPDCPNVLWEESITEMAFTSATITVEQGGNIVLTIECAFGAPTANGAISKDDVDCVQIQP